MKKGLRILLFDLVVLFVLAIIIKPSDKKCKRIAAEKISEFKKNKFDNTNIFVKNDLLYKTLFYTSGRDTHFVGHAFYFWVKIREDNLRAIE